MLVYVGGSKVRVDPKDAVGQGGEAYVFRLKEVAVKIFKGPDDPEFQNDLSQQEAARKRLEEHQQKLQSFPPGLPPKVVVPKDLVYNDRQEVVGYTMDFLDKSEPLLRYKQRSFRQGIDSNQVVDIFRDLHGTVEGVHKAKAVVGDYNDLNVLVVLPQAWIIDSDSFQFGNYYCRMFTDRFVDPTLCDPNGTKLHLIRPHTELSDWYAYNVMLFESMLFVDPYGGVYKPKDTSNLIPHGARPLKRITVFHPEVRYPKPAVPVKLMPDDLLHHFHCVFEKDKREKFPRQLLDTIRWTKCTQCGVEHARAKCPECFVAAPAAVVTTVRVKGTVTSQQIFRTTGVILASAYQDKLRWLYHENGSYRRDAEGTEILSTPIMPFVRYRLQRSKTHFGQGNALVTIEPGHPQVRRAVDTYGGNLPVFDSGEKLYWMDAGRLMREGVELAGTSFPESMGQLLHGHTLFWVGSTFGFGFYRAAGLAVAFVFNANSKHLNENVKMPRINGQLTDTTAVFGKDRCWFMIATQEAGKTMHRCFCISQGGEILATAEAEAGDGSWLGSIRGKAAAGNFLFSATDEGLVRQEVQGSTIAETRKYPDTEPFINSGSQINMAKEGLYVVDQNEIRLLRIQ